jgi:hypothetical protein
MASLRKIVLTGSTADRLMNTCGSPMTSGRWARRRCSNSLDFDTLDALGIKIVEGEYPGSTYYAAELMVAVEAANVVAGRLGVPVRFRCA